MNPHIEDLKDCVFILRNNHSKINTHTNMSAQHFWLKNQYKLASELKKLI